jgi:hypothetical protein
VKALREGRAGEVTDDMLGALTPEQNARLFNAYERGETGADMAMDEASRMARAKEMGFDVDAYHGGAGSPQSLDPDMGDGKTYDTGVWTTRSPEVANTYAKDMFDDGSIMPLRLNTSKNGVTNWLGRSWGDGPPRAYMRGPDGRGAFFKDMREDFQSWASSDEAARGARESGAGGLTFKNIVDTGPNTFKETSAATNDVMFDPRNIRSRFARFDPRLKHLSNLSAAVPGLFGAGTLGALLAARDDEVQQ